MGHFTINRRFLNFRTHKVKNNKIIDRLLKEIDKKIINNGTLTYSPGFLPNSNADCFMLIRKNGKLQLANKFFSLKEVLINALYKRRNLGIVLNCFTGQIYKGLEIKEVWSYKLQVNSLKTTIEELSHEELYESFTTDASTGQFVQGEPNTVYCGPKGKICGWDMY